MGRARPLRAIDVVQKVLQRVAIEATAGMQRQWRWLVQHDDRVVLVQDANVRRDVGLARGWEHVPQAFAGTKDLVDSGGLLMLIKHSPGRTDRFPFVSRHMRKNAAEEFN